jgi:hypothetical protein
VTWGKTDYIPHPFVYLYRVKEQQARLEAVALDKSKAIPALVEDQLRWAEEYGL